MKMILKLGNLRFLLFTIILFFKSVLAWRIVFENGPSWTTLADGNPIHVGGVLPD